LQQVLMNLITNSIDAMKMLKEGAGDHPLA
jgi:C4-dicarboxylate-specific signal transduction histidine kinase